MSPDAVYSLSVEAKEELRTRDFESPELIRLQDENVYSLPSSSSSNAVGELRSRSPFHPTMRSSSSSSSQTSQSEVPEDDRDSREGSVSATSNKSEEKVEKRKRLRVTPEQLQHLERFFLLDRNPTAARRREIGQLLGMQERQTQIWFQNRRAKAKLLDGRKQQHRRVTVEVPPPDSPPQLCTGIQVDLHNLIHEDDPVTIIPCTDLSIGSWRRIATAGAKHDLVAYVSDVKRSLTWFIRSDGFGFKMEIPFDTILETKFTDAAPGSGLASFLLSEPPLFYLENIELPSTDESSKRHWKRCADWTEGQQASRVLRHNLVGSAPQLSHLLSNLRNQAPTNFSLHQPSYPPDQCISHVSPMELPLPPMANFEGLEFRNRQHDAMEPSVTHHSSRFEKRSSFVGLGVTLSSNFPYSNEGDRPPLYSTPSNMSVSFTQESEFQQQRRRSSLATFGADGGSAYSGFGEHGAIHRSTSADNFSEIPISHGLAPRPFSTQAIPRPFHHNTSQRGMQSYDGQEEHSQIRRVSTPSSTTSVHTTYEQSIPSLLDPQRHQRFVMQPSPSPPLLTMPYHPPPHMLNRPVHTDHIGDASSLLNSSYPGIDYQA